jgi:hypothetical protein
MGIARLSNNLHAYRKAQTRGAIFANSLLLALEEILERFWSEVGHGVKILKVLEWKSAPFSAFPSKSLAPKSLTRQSGISEW